MVELLFSFSGTIGRRAYLLTTLAGVFLKHIVDLIVAGAFHYSWTPLNYLVPLGIPISGLSQRSTDLAFILGLTAISLPFAWVGVALTVKRFRAIGWPLWLVVVFFLPVVNIATFALAAAWPEQHALQTSPKNGWLTRFIPNDTFGAATVALFVTVILGALGVVLGTTILNKYGWGLFAAIPFTQGAIASTLFNVHVRRTLAQNVVVSLVSISLTGLVLLATALEGAICLFMAMPIALVFAAMGAVLVHAISQPFQNRPISASFLVFVLLAPAIMGAESIVPHEAPVYTVTSFVDIHASPSTVWAHVIRFPDLPPPTEVPFRLGVAFPERARIDGSGVGAIRHCEFSTGSFTEPITVWKPEHQLAFDVTYSPEPMREWSPYGTIDTPHLHGYMISRHGEFDLVQLPGNRTRLIGRTWYQHHLWPSAYWALWSNAIIHQIHMRVLDHIKALSEADLEKTAHELKSRRLL